MTNTRPRRERIATRFLKKVLGSKTECGKYRNKLNGNDGCRKKMNKEKTEKNGKNENYCDIDDQVN